MTTDANTNEAAPVYWPRVKELLDGIMARWIERHGRQPYPGIHEYWWETPEDLANSVLNGYPSIEPGKPGAETHLVRSLRLGCGTFGRMPLRGPFLSRAEAAEIAAWIDAGMPKGPGDDHTVTVLTVMALAGTHLRGRHCRLPAGFWRVPMPIGSPLPCRPVLRRTVRRCQ